MLRLVPLAAALSLSILPARSIAASVGGDPVRPGMRIKIDFPLSARNQESRLTYLLRPGADLKVDLQLSLGPDAVKPPQHVRGALFIDGRQQRVSADGGPARADFSVRLTQVGELQRISLRLAGARIKEGAHSAALLLWRDGGGSFPSAGFTIFKGGRNFHPRPLSPLFKKQPGTGGASSEVRAVARPEVLMRGAIPGVEPDAGGGLSLRIATEGDPATSATADPSHYSVVAIVDGNQVPLAKASPSLHDVLDAGQRATADVTIAGLPLKGSSPEHTLAVFLIPGDGKVSEEPTGTPAPWYRPPQLIGWLRW